MLSFKLKFSLPLLALLSVACSGGTNAPGDGGSNPTPAPGNFRMAGTISVAANSDVDSDTNDPNGNPRNNNDFSRAQPLANPVSVGGYVRTSSSDGRGCAPGGFGGDSIDFFALELFAAQIIELLIADLEVADLDLFLLDASGNVVDSSVAARSNESVVVPSDGDYFIAVCSFSGQSSYVLGVGQSQGQFGLPTYRSSLPQQLREAMVEWTAQKAARVSLSSGDLVFQKRAQGQDGISLMHWQPSAQRKASVWQFVDPQQAERHASLLELKALAAQPGVTRAEPNYLRRPFASTNDPGLPFQWHYPLIEVPQAWDITTGSPAVVTAVIDTGVLLNHPDMQGQFDPNDPDGFDFISDPDRARDGSGRDGNANDVGDNGVGGSSFHGTHVAGTVAAAGNNGDGVTGIAYTSRIMPLRALGQSGGTAFDIRQALLYAAGLNSAAPAPPPRRADIINLSLGGGGFSQIEQDAYTAARNQGVIIIAAAGNQNSGQPSFPASYDGVVSVAAVTIERQRAPYSNFGSRIDVAAPGGNTGRDVDGDGFVDGVLSTGGDDSTGSTRFVYPFLQGTSMAAPHVAGVAALMKSVHPGLTPAQFDSLLVSGSISSDLGAPGRDDLFGHGLINARLAVQQAVALAGGGPAPDNPELSVTPRSLGFGAVLNSLDLNVANVGSGDLNITSVSDDASWLTVTPTDVDGNGLGRYRAVASRSGLADGAYQAHVTVQSSAGTQRVPVLLQVGAQFAVDAGFHYVLLVDDDRNVILAQDEVALSDGVYRFAFENVPPGNYKLIAGSDNDNDTFLCDAGEACGAYRTIEQPEVITISNSDRLGLDFGTGFEVEFNQNRAGITVLRAAQ